MRRVPISPHCHPLVKQFFEAFNMQKTSLRDVARISGISRSAFRDWKLRRNPTIANFDAALNALGLELSIRERTGHN